MEKNQALVYIAEIKGADWQALYARFKDNLNPLRVERIENAANVGVKKELVCTGVLLQGVLRSQGASFRDFEYGPNGKPSLKDRDDVFFNISHSGNYVVIALCGQEVGVDVQKPVPYKEALVNRISTMDERSRLGDIPVKHLNYMWAVKEAYTKLTGEGISKNLADITFEKSDENIIISDMGENAAYGKSIISDDLYEAVIATREPLENVNVSRMAL